MTLRTKKSRFAQNRIAYIVYNDPKQVQQLIDQHGYEVPHNAHHLVKATKQLVRRKGRRFVQELLALHPDRKAIIQVEKNKEDHFCGACGSHAYSPEDNYCNACGHSAYTGEKDKGDFLQQLVQMGLKELEELYEHSVQKANKEPANVPLAEQVRLVWNELRLRKKEVSEKIPPTPSNDRILTDGIVVKPHEALAILAATLLAGGLIGSAWKFQKRA